MEGFAKALGGHARMGHMHMGRRVARHWSYKNIIAFVFLHKKALSLKLLDTTFSTMVGVEISGPSEWHGRLHP